MQPSIYVIRPRPPLRAAALVAVLVAASAGLIVAGSALSVLWVSLVGLVPLALALVIVVVLIRATQSSTARLSLTDDGWEVSSRVGARAGRWADITKVTSAPGRLTFHEQGDRHVRVGAAAGTEVDLDAIGRDVSSRLDASRGFRPYQ